jgi:hypothetical protein
MASNSQRKRVRNRRVVLRIRDPDLKLFFYPGSGSKHFSFRILHKKGITNKKFLFSGFLWVSAASLHSRIRIPDPGGKKAPDPYPQHCLRVDILTEFLHATPHLRRISGTVDWLATTGFRYHPYLVISLFCDFTITDILGTGSFNTVPVPGTQRVLQSAIEILYLCIHFLFQADSGTCCVYFCCEYEHRFKEDSCLA